MSDKTAPTIPLWVASFDRQWQSRVRPVGTLLVDLFHYALLFAIGAATVWAAGISFLEMMQKGTHATVEDLLLLFIFLEVGAMVGIYFRTSHMPVRFLMYVAITAVTRHMISFVNRNEPAGMELLVLAISILVLALALLAIRFASYNYPAGRVREPSFATDVDGPDK